MISQKWARERLRMSELGRTVSREAFVSTRARGDVGGVGVRDNELGVRSTRKEWPVSSEKN